MLCLALCLAHPDPDCEPTTLFDLGPASLLLDGGGPGACSAHLAEVYGGIAAPCGSGMGLLLPNTSPSS